MTAPLLITMGDPTGVGPEIIIKALIEDALPKDRPLTVVGDAAVLARAARIFTSDIILSETSGPLSSHTLSVAERSLALQTISNLDAKSLRYGTPDAACGQAMLDYIEWAIARCRTGEAAGMVTAPISKAAIHAAGCHFPGHTELLAERCGIDKVVMMLAGSRLRVSLVTTHLALSEVPSRLTVDEIVATIRITDQDLRTFFGITQPKIAVLALNPHASEGGMFGNEEAQLITPAIAAARSCGIEASGPHSADTLFHFATNGSYDAVVCMYHDQGLIPLKLLHFEDGVNVTLGLPIVRTSVDHGTAYDIAGHGKASAASLVAAVKMAVDMSRHI